LEEGSPFFFLFSPKITIPPFPSRRRERIRFSLSLFYFATKETDHSFLLIVDEEVLR
jgi:hypothetical protein